MRAAFTSPYRYTRWEADVHHGVYDASDASSLRGFDGWTRSSRAGKDGRYQFHRPKIATSAGTNNMRTTVASSRIPAPRPVPITLTSVPGLDDRATKAKNRISAAQVTSRPVRPSPVTTALLVDPVLSYSSRIRERMNTS